MSSLYNTCKGLNLQASVVLRVIYLFQNLSLKKISCSASFFPFLFCLAVLLVSFCTKKQERDGLYLLFSGLALAWIFAKFRWHKISAEKHLFRRSLGKVKCSGGFLRFPSAACVGTRSSAVLQREVARAPELGTNTRKQLFSLGHQSSGCYLRIGIERTRARYFPLQYCRGSRSLVCASCC
jgi:hypothetical protein